MPGIIYKFENQKAQTFFNNMKFMRDFPFSIYFDFEEAKLFARCSLLVTFYSLLVTFCSLLFARWLLFFARCFLLVARCSLLLARCSLFFRPNYCKIKLLCIAKKWSDSNETPPQIFSVQISEIFVTFSGWWFSKFSQHVKLFSKMT